MQQYKLLLAQLQLQLKLQQFSLQQQQPVQGQTLQPETTTTKQQQHFQHQGGEPQEHETNDAALEQDVIPNPQPGQPVQGQPLQPETTTTTEQQQHFQHQGGEPQEHETNDAALEQDVVHDEIVGGRRKSWWTQDEDEALLQLCKDYRASTISWEEIASVMNGRIAVSCYNRYRLLKSGKLVHKPRHFWTADEDKALVHLCRDIVCWEEIASVMNGRTALACRRRYLIVRGYYLMEAITS